MPEPNIAVAETPVVPPVTSTTETVPLSEQEITDTYLEKRMEGKTEDLPVPLPGIPDEPPVVPEVPPEVPPTPEAQAAQAVDAYIDERQQKLEEKKKRRERGGVQARIDQLTKEKADAEERAAKLEAEKAHAPIPPGTIEETKEHTEESKPSVEVVSEPKPRPRMNEFDDADNYHAAMAMWAAEESNRTRPPAVQPKVEMPKEPEPNQVRKEEFDRFMDRGRAFVTTHSDFNTTLEAAHVRGLTISEGARIAIMKKAVPEVAYWLAKPENDLAARSMMKMDEIEQIVEVGRIAERLAVSPTDFVSNAPTPGLRLTGANARMEVPLNQVQDTDEYIRRRRQERRGRR